MHRTALSGDLAAKTSSPLLGRKTSRIPRGRKDLPALLGQMKDDDDDDTTVNIYQFQGCRNFRQ